MLQVQYAANHYIEVRCPNAACRGLGCKALIRFVSYDVMLTFEVFGESLQRHVRGQRQA